jgi:DNA repair protein RadC
MADLYVQSPGGGFTLADDKIVLTAAEHAARRGLQRGARFSKVEEVKPWLVATIGAKPYECFCVAYLDDDERKGLLSFDEISRGTSQFANVNVREVLKRALNLDAEYMVLAHNHPKRAKAEPSDQDILTTVNLGALCAQLDICVLDHFIVAGDQVTSMRDTGCFEKERVMKALVAVNGKEILEAVQPTGKAS